MIQLLNPLWLLAIGAIIIPLAIHLWNIKKGKTLKIGSIQLLGESSRQNSRSLRLLDLLLLFLRCLMLVVLALLLAGPVLSQRTAEEKPKGWVLIDREHVKETYFNFKPKIDSLLKGNYELHYLAPGFEDIDIEDLRNDRIELKPDVTSGLSYWSLVKALDKQLPPTTNTYIFTSNRLNRFAGQRPKLNSKIIWETYTPADSVYNQIAAAYLTATDSLRLVLAHSQPTGNTYTYDNTSVNNPNPAYQIFRENQLSVSFKNTGVLPIAIDSSAATIDTSVMRIALFTDKYPADLAYLKAGLEAVKTFSRRRISIDTYADRAKIPTGLSWLFWLSESPVPEKAKYIFSYQTGKTLAVYNSIVTHEGKFVNRKSLSLYQMTVPSKTAQWNEMLWQDESGNPILSLNGDENVSKYKFYSHFDPEWNDLVWSAEFPEWLLNLLLQAEDKNSGLVRVLNADRRVIDFSQISPIFSQDGQETSAKAKIKEVSLEHFFWLLLISLFALERWASYKQKALYGI